MDKNRITDRQNKSRQRDWKKGKRMKDKHRRRKTNQKKEKLKITQIHKTKENPKDWEIE